MPVGHWDARDETDYENLDYFVGSLQQSAIDLYMYSNYNFLKSEEPSSHLYTLGGISPPATMPYAR